MRILAVDDDPVFIELMKATLTQLGYTDFETAESAREAAGIINAATTPFDCFLLDVQMPEIDGIDLCRWIHRNATYRTTPILMVTAISDKHYIDEAFAAGATDYVNKPLDVTELKARLHTMRSLSEKTLQANDLAARLLHSDTSNSVSFCFDDTVFLDDVAGHISYLAMENYLMKLGTIGMFTSSVVGFSVGNAQDIFANCGRQEFVDVMATIAEIIQKNISEWSLLTYVGCGNFAVIVNRVSGIAWDEIHDNIRAEIESQSFLFDAISGVLPVVSVGHPTTFTLFGRSTPGATMQKAIASAKDAQSRRAGRSSGKMSFNRLFKFAS